MSMFNWSSWSVCNSSSRRTSEGRLESGLLLHITFHTTRDFDGEVSLLLPEAFVPVEPRGVIDCKTVESTHSNHWTESFVLIYFTRATNFLASMKLRAALFILEEAFYRSVVANASIFQRSKISSRSTSYLESPHSIYRRCQ